MTPIPPDPPEPRTRRAGAALIMQAAALVLLVIGVVLATIHDHTGAATVVGVLLIAVFGWLLAWSYRQYRWIQDIRLLDREREDWGGWDNMSDELRARWLADLEKVIRS
jgi:hypothetical protein